MSGQDCSLTMYGKSQSKLQGYTRICSRTVVGRLISRDRNTPIFQQVSGQAELIAHGPCLGSVGVESHDHFRTCYGTKFGWLVSRDTHGPVFLQDPVPTRLSMDCSWEGLESNIWLFQDLWEADMSVSLPDLWTNKTVHRFQLRGARSLLQGCYKMYWDGVSRSCCHRLPDCGQEGLQSLVIRPLKYPQTRPKLMGLLSEACVGMIPLRSFGIQCW